MPRQSELGVGKNSRILSVRLSAELDDAWKGYVEKNKTTGQEAVRRVIRFLCNMPGDESEAPEKIRALIRSVQGTRRQDYTQADKQKKKRIGLSLTPNEIEILSDMAEQHECSVQHMAVSLIRHCLSKAPVVGGLEARELGESNYEIFKIGTNLNQIAHEINAHKSMAVDVPTCNRVLAQIEILSGALKKHTGKVYAVMKSCSARWIIK